VWEISRRRRRRRDDAAGDRRATTLTVYPPTRVDCRPDTYRWTSARDGPSTASCSRRTNDIIKSLGVQYGSRGSLSSLRSLFGSVLWTTSAGAGIWSSQTLEFVGGRPIHTRTTRDFGRRRLRPARHVRVLTVTVPNRWAGGCPTTSPSTIANNTKSSIEPVPLQIPTLRRLTLRDDGKWSIVPEPTPPPRPLERLDFLPRAIHLPSRIGDHGSR